MARPYLLALLVWIAVGAGCAATDEGTERGRAGTRPGAPAIPAGVVAPAREEPDLDALTAAVRERPDNYDARRMLAIGLHGSGLKHEAVAEFEKAVELKSDVRSLLDLALAYSSISRLPEARSTYERLLELQPGHPVALHNLGNMALQRGEVERAIELYESAIRAKPDYLLAQSHLADALRRAERLKDAYRAYEQVLELEPTNPVELERYDDALYQMAALDISMGAHQRAGRMLVELVRANPNHPKAHYALGQVLMQVGRTEDAQREFQIHAKLMSEREATGPVATAE